MSNIFIQEIAKKIFEKTKLEDEIDLDLLLENLKEKLLLLLDPDFIYSSDSSEDINEKKIVKEKFKVNIKDGFHELVFD
tara:strand:+ start:40 stop:276 length:237 start_codon:yes stop_codon:yes gene_type:complete